VQIARAFVDISARDTTASVAQVARTSERARRICAPTIAGVAVVQIARAFVDVDTGDAVVSVSRAANALVRAHIVDAGGTCAARARNAAFINVGAIRGRSITRVTRARETSRTIDAHAVTAGGCALVNVCAC
jgi:hypothetical protein